LQAEFQWQLEETTRKFLDYRKRQVERVQLSVNNDELRRKQDTLLGRQVDRPAAPVLEFHIQESVKVQRREWRPRWTPPKPRGELETCVVCARGEPGLGTCSVCLSAVHTRCSRHRREPICSVDCSIKWMEAFGHA
jgi:hypothetical protein